MPNSAAISLGEKSWAGNIKAEFSFPADRSQNCTGNPKTTSPKSNRVWPVKLHLCPAKRQPAHGSCGTLLLPACKPCRQSHPNPQAQNHSLNVWDVWSRVPELRHKVLAQSEGKVWAADLHHPQLPPPRQTDTSLHRAAGPALGDTAVTSPGQPRHHL